jgi:ABC-type hemin transport system substrate-binding protein
VGFPNTDYISSEKHEKELWKVREVGRNENLNTEVLIDMEPDAIVVVRTKQQQSIVIYFLQKKGQIQR